ncbi:histidinol-phosphate transaminase [Marinoscillum furvescens]|uniref:Histidinol-phosphate aminotransferase n=1 Tax=Marinoscillum furvescens DSM 4134 TaxID=1122208 RepID=A0A3D9L8Q4_MARFU|nr:histidinol-phosphate transaminase [Marinoscillum furvescens]REE02056.1 histidinol-phosphate aminotransferase [Marinoscillum furvescens DSM 4134]
MKAYSSARDEFEGEAEVFLDANENALGSAASGHFNRYPDPHHKALKERWSALKGVGQERIFFGNGSDEPIDLLIRLFCEPGKDYIITLPPTYGMYKVSASINAVENKLVPLTPDFELDMPALTSAWDEHAKLLFLCSPNNPSGNLLRRQDMHELIKSFPGIVVVDEAYIDFSPEASWIDELEKYPNLVVLQTLSKAWGMAGIRVGVAMGDPYVIAMLEKIKPPYNLSLANQQLALEAMANHEKQKNHVQTLLAEREKLIHALEGVEQVRKIVPSAANFLLVEFDRADELFHFMIERGVIVRNRTRELHCEGCLRVTVGTSAENQRFLTLVNDFYA